MTAVADVSQPAPFFEPVLGLLSSRDFAFARRSSRGFSRWNNYRDFLSERDSLYVGYGECGVDARFQRVPFAALECFSRLTGAPVDVNGLDVFAAHWRYRVRHPDAPVMGKFGFPDEPERSPVGVAGVQRLTIRPEVYVRWRDDFAKIGLWKAPAIDVYAAHVVEFCVAANPAARRPEVSSS